MADWGGATRSCRSASFFRFFVGLALARGDPVEGAPLRLHPHVGVTGEPGARDGPGDAHDHLIASPWTRSGSLNPDLVI